MADGNPKIVAKIQSDTGNFETGMHKVRKATDQTSTAIKKANTHLRMMRGGFGQVGHQVQDIAVQLQMGQNALLVFGQQGSQIASLFGPGGAVIGAFLAVGAALGMALMPALFGANQAMKDLEDQSKNLYERFDELDGVLRLEALRQAAERQKELNDAIAEANKVIAGKEYQINRLEKRLNTNTEAVDQLKESIQEQQGIIALANLELGKLAKQTDGTTDAFEKQEQKLKDQIKTFDKSAQAIRDYGLKQMFINKEITKSEYNTLLALSHILGEKERLKEQEVEAEKEKQKALRKAEKEEEAAQRQLQKMRDRFSGQMADGFVDAITGAKSFADAMKGVAKSVVDSLLKMIIQKLITDQIFNAMMPFFSGLPGATSYDFAHWWLY